MPDQRWVCHVDFSCNPPQRSTGVAVLSKNLDRRFDDLPSTLNPLRVWTSADRVWFRRSRRFQMNIHALKLPPAYLLEQRMVTTGASEVLNRLSIRPRSGAAGISEGCSSCRWVPRVHPSTLSAQCKRDLSGEPNAASCQDPHIPLPKDYRSLIFFKSKRSVR